MAHKSMSRLEAERAGYTVKPQREGYGVHNATGRVEALPLYETEYSAWVAAAAFDAGRNAKP